MAKDKEKKNGGDYGEQYDSNVVRTAFIDGVHFYSKEVQYAVVDGLAIFEGDIVLGTVEEVERKTELRRQELRGEVLAGIVRTGDQFRWPNCTVPYTIDPNLTNQARVTDAIAHWEANTGFSFVLRINANAAQLTDFVTFQPGSGCSSWVGRQGGQQFITLAPGCSTGSTIHEIGHAVGLWHEHSREDRNAFVTINWDKIMSGREHNFNQHITDGDDVGTYDYGSIMHYPRTAFSTDGSETISPTDPNAVIGQRNGLSAGDIAAANFLCPPERVCPVAPHRICPGGPVVHVQCPPAPVSKFCPTAPFHRICPPAPFHRICPPAPFHRICPPATFQRACPPGPWGRGCLAGPYKRPEPWIPRFRMPEFRLPRFRMPTFRNYDYYPGYGYSDPFEYTDPNIHAGSYGYADPYGYPDPYGYADPYGYSHEQGNFYGEPYHYGYDPNWTATEYSNPRDEGCCEENKAKEDFDPKSDDLNS